MELCNNIQKFTLHKNMLYMVPFTVLALTAGASAPVFLYSFNHHHQIVPLHGIAA